MIIHIEKGQITNKGAVRKFFENHTDGSWTLRSAKGKKRSQGQNALYWAYIIPQVKNGLKDLGIEQVAKFCSEYLGFPLTLPGNE